MFSFLTGCGDTSATYVDAHIYKPIKAHIKDLELGLVYKGKTYTEIKLFLHKKTNDPIYEIIDHTKEDFETFIGSLTQEVESLIDECLTQDSPFKKYDLTKEIRPILMVPHTEPWFGSKK